MTLNVFKSIQKMRKLAGNNFMRTLYTAVRIQDALNMPFLYQKLRREEPPPQLIDFLKSINVNRKYSKLLVLRSYQEKMAVRKDLYNYQYLSIYLSIFLSI